MAALYALDVKRTQGTFARYLVSLDQEGSRCSVERFHGQEMNAARLTRRWQEAAGDPARMVEALVEEINDPATGLVTRDFLRAELAQVREELATLRGELRSEIIAVGGEFWRVVLIVFGAQIILVGILVAILVQVLG
jgi:hypothetical protein